jgi:cytoskeleton protein RodZ
MTSSYPLKQEAQLSDKTSAASTNNMGTSVGRMGPGQQLQIARENLRYSIEQVAAHLHLTSSVVSDIEGDRFDKGVPFTYTRGYLRSYARLVGISPDAVVKAFDQLGLEDQRGAVKMPLKSTKRPMRIQLAQLRWVLYAVIVIAILGGIVWWFNQPTETDPMQEDLMQLLHQITPEKTTTGE